MEQGAVGVIVDVDGLPPIYLWSCYGHNSLGMGPRQRQFLAALGRRAVARRNEFLLAGDDFNVTPTQFRDAGWLKKAGLSTVNSGKVTCRSPTTAVEYDYFLATPLSARVVIDISRQSDTILSHHQPVCPATAALGDKLKHLTVVTPKILPREFPFGPATAG